MCDQNHLRRLRSNGFCVVESVIPGDAIDLIRDDVTVAVFAHQERTEVEMSKIRSRGHRIGTQGAGVQVQIINETQSFAPYLANSRILDLAESVFGPFVRISSTGGAVNHPGNSRGY